MQDRDAAAFMGYEAGFRLADSDEYLPDVAAYELEEAELQMLSAEEPTSFAEANQEELWRGRLLVCRFARLASSTSEFKLCQVCSANRLTTVLTI
jgi:hypothetical protein